MFRLLVFGPSGLKDHGSPTLQILPSGNLGHTYRPDGDELGGLAPFHPSFTVYCLTAASARVVELSDDDGLGGCIFLTFWARSVLKILLYCTGCRLIGSSKTSKKSPLLGSFELVMQH